MKIFSRYKKGLPVIYSACAGMLVAVLFTCCTGTGANNNSPKQDENSTAFTETVAHSNAGSAANASSKLNAKTVAYQMDNANALKATLTGNARPLPVYGFNGNISRGPSWGNKAFRDTVASLGLKIIRYPGGSVSNFWDWKKGWFVEGDDHDVKKTKALYNSAITEENEYSLNKLKMIVDAAKCDVVFTLNMVTKSLDDQVDMLKNAQSLGIPVKWIELGNEFNLQKNPAKEKFNTAEAYGKMCSQWIAGLKQQFPNAQIAVVGGNRNYNSDVKNWNNTVLSNAPNADAVVAHIYAAPGKVVDASGINYQNLYRSFSNGFKEEGFDEISNKKIWVTEYNIIWSVAKDKNITANALSWGQALGALLMTSALTGLSDNVQLVLNHNIGNADIFAAVETNNKTFEKLPNGIGMQEWFTASNQMTQLQKISFGQDTPEYETFGWKFSNNQGKSNLLLCNLTSQPNAVDVSGIAGFKTASYKVMYADKQAALNAVTSKNGTLSSGTLDLPPYAVAIVSNQ